MERKLIMNMNLRCEIQLQMSTMLKFKYYGHHVMSRKFKYRYIEIIWISANAVISYEISPKFDRPLTGANLPLPQ